MFPRIKSAVKAGLRFTCVFACVFRQQYVTICIRDKFLRKRASLWAENGKAVSFIARYALYTLYTLRFTRCELRIVQPGGYEPPKGGGVMGIAYIVAMALVAIIAIVVLGNNRRK